MTEEQESTSSGRPRDDAALVVLDRSPGGGAVAPSASKPGAMAKLADTMSRTVLGVQHERQVAAMRETLVGPGRTLLFSFGFAAGFFVMMLLLSLLAPITVVTAPMAFILATSGGVAGGLLFSRVFRIKDSLTTEEQLGVERATARRNRLLADLEEQERELRARGIPADEIEARLGPERDGARREYRDEVRRLTEPARSSDEQGRR